jgi:hypothetical protein
VIYGIPNPLIGAAGVPVVLTTDMALLAGARLARWYWNGILHGATAGVELVHWLMFRACTGSGLARTAWRSGSSSSTFWYAAAAHVHLTPTAQRRERSGWRQVPRRILTSWYLIIATLITKRFWDYWTTLLP